jgi:hypothetical protein
MPDCIFHQGPLAWRGKPLPLILDHISGNRLDHRPGNLQLLCPNCDSQQLLTRGGANVGHVIELGERKFTLVWKSPTGRTLDYNKIPGTGGSG